MKTVGIIGINGIVGQTLRRLLSRDANIQIKEFSRKDELTDMDIAVLCTDNADSAALAERLHDKTDFIIDMSSQFRLDPKVPLVIPEINPEAITKETKLIASPNCTTTGLVMALKPLMQKYEIKEVFFCSYQAVSGGGKKLIEESAVPSSVYHKNCVPQIGAISDECGYCSEELKTVYETHKILNLPSLPVYPHTMRVYVDNGHSLGVTVKLASPAALPEIKMLFAQFPGVVYGENMCTPKEATGKNEVFICRLRQDIADNKTIHFFITFDNILKGAALNAKQIINEIMNRIYGEKSSS